MKRRLVAGLVLVLVLGLLRANHEAEDQAVDTIQPVKTEQEAVQTIKRYARPWLWPAPGKPVVEVDLSETALTDIDLKELTGLKQLRELNLGSTQVTDSGLKALAAFTQLQSLDLGGTSVTDAGLKALAALNRLQSLNLGRTQVTDNG